jgi:hypothetical protein
MADNNDQLELDFPSTDDFESFDEADSEEVEAEMPSDSFDESSVTDSERGCCF